MLNKVILMGRLTKDPELRYTASNIPVCNFTLAVDRNYARQGEEKQTDFIRIIAWRNTAEFVGKYYRKGLQVVVSGRIQTSTWDDQDGKRHFVTEVVTDETYFADSKRDTDNTNRFNSQPANEISQEVEGFMPVEADDDLPF
ncbi:MAG: single-stranded DNA-binding protein [Firmicutes bacterium]|nr:single-stranded DNA-binding protein [Bacillota bacterium]